MLYSEKLIDISRKKKENLLLGFAEFLIVLWISAVVIMVIPGAYEAFGPVKNMLLIFGIWTPFLLVFLVLQKESFTVSQIPRPWLYFFLIPIIWAWMGSGFGPEPFLFTGYIAAAGMAGLMGMDGKTNFLFRIWVGLGWVQSILVLLQFVGLDPFHLWTGAQSTWKVYGTLGNPNLVAGFLVPVFFLAQCPEIIKQKRWRFPAFLIMSLAIVATGSRVGVILLALGLIIWAGDNYRGKGKKVFLLVPLGLMVGGFSAGALMGKGLDSISGRLLFWRAGWEMIKEQPWVGHGLGSFRGLYPQGVARLSLEEGAPLALPVNAHNDWIEFALELGLIPGIILFSVAIWAVRGAWLERKKCVAIALGVIFLQAGWDALLRSVPTALLFFMLLGSVSGSFVRYPKAGKRILIFWIISVAVISLVAFSGSGLFFQQMQAHLAGGQAREISLKGNWEESGELWQKTRDLDPFTGEFAYWYAQILALKGDYSGALGLLKEAGKTYSDFHLYILKSRLEYRAGKKDQAIERLEWMRTVFPDYEPAIYYLNEFKNLPE